jgi:hypothetical protein
MKSAVGLQALVFEYWKREGQMFIKGNGIPFKGEMKDIIPFPTNNTGNRSSC